MALSRTSGRRKVLSRTIYEQPSVDRLIARLVAALTHVSLSVIWRCPLPHNGNEFRGFPPFMSTVR